MIMVSVMMSAKRNFLGFVVLLILTVSVERYCEALASQAVYLIENLGSKQCLSAGGVLRSFNNSNISLFKQGRAMSKPCSDITSFNSTDFSQEWMVRIQKENLRNFTYQIQLAMLNTLYYDVNLTADIRGEFILYFPDKINLKMHGMADESTQSQGFIISDPGTQNCLSDGVEEKGVQFVKCVENNDFQIWNFTLVNEKLIVHGFFTMPPPSPLR